MNDADVLNDLAETDVPDRPSGVRHKAAARSPNFNKLPRPTARVISESERTAFRCAVRQPPVLPMFVKPLKPLGKR
jgi:hypothetical protein